MWQIANLTKYKYNKMQKRCNANVTKCKWDEFQLGQNIFKAWCICNKMQMRQNAFITNWILHIYCFICIFHLHFVLFAFCYISKMRPPYQNRDFTVKVVAANWFNLISCLSISFLFYLHLFMEMCLIQVVCIYKIGLL